MDILRLSVGEHAQIHAVTSDKRRVQIVLGLYPEKRLSIDDLVEETGLPKDTIKYKLKLLEETGFVDDVAQSAEIYYLTEKGKNLVQTFHRLLQQRTH